MPSLGFDMTEGKLARWLKKVGDKIDKGEAIAEIETEKATVEIEATAPGTVREIIVPPGQTVPVGTVIAVIAELGGAQPAVTTPATAMAEPKRETARPPVPATSRPATGGNGGRQNAPERTAVETGVETRVKASPLARRMAQAAGVDLAQIHGTGPGGRIMERDIEAATAQRAPTTPAQRPAPPAPPSSAPVPPAPAAPGGESVSLNKMRQAIARRMTESKTTVPHFYVTVEINLDAAMNVRQQLNALASDADKVSVNDLVIAAVARTLRQFPNFNASFHDGALQMHPQINIGLAVALEDGLITPVVRDADQKSLRMIATQAKQLGERARSNKLRADDLGGATFTVSNLGMFGADEFIAIINPPEAAILAVGAATRRPVVVDDAIRIATVMKATLSVDHRVADGAQAARFLQAFRKLLENPVNLLVNG